MSFTNTIETRLLQWLLTTASVTRPTSWHIALFTAAPSDAGGGTEVTGGAYVRMPAGFTVAGDKASNTLAVEWPTATANWGTITHAALFDAATGGTMLTHAALTAPKTIEIGDVFRFPIGDFSVTLD